MSKNVFGKIEVNLYKILIIQAASCWGAKGMLGQISGELLIQRG